MNIWSIVGIVIISPAWGVMSTWLFLQSWLSLIGAFLGIIGLIRGKVERKVLFASIGLHILTLIACSALLSLGYYLFSYVFQFGYSKIENIVYWLFAGISFIFIIIEYPHKIKKGWRQANVVGEIESDVIKRRFRRWGW